MNKAIETRYNGYRFRSRLEARWAVFFDHMGMPWQYEVEGYDLGEQGWYLPDFFLTSNRTYGPYIEVKGRRPNREELDKMIALCSDLRCYGTFLFGSMHAPQWIDVHKEGWIDREGTLADFSGECQIFPYPRTANIGPAIAAACAARFEHGEQG